MISQSSADIPISSTFSIHTVSFHTYAIDIIQKGLVSANIPHSDETQYNQVIKQIFQIFCLVMRNTAEICLYCDRSCISLSDVHYAWRCMLSRCVPHINTAGFDNMAHLKADNQDIESDLSYEASSTSSSSHSDSNYEDIMSDEMEDTLNTNASRTFEHKVTSSAPIAAMTREDIDRSQSSQDESSISRDDTSEINLLDTHSYSGDIFTEFLKDFLTQYQMLRISVKAIIALKSAFEEHSCLSFQKDPIW